MIGQSENPIRDCVDLPSALQESVSEVLEEADLDQTIIDQIMELIETGERQKYEMSGEPCPGNSQISQK